MLWARGSLTQLRVLGLRALIPAVKCKDIIPCIMSGIVRGNNPSLVLPVATLDLGLGSFKALSTLLVRSVTVPWGWRAVSLKRLLGFSGANGLRTENVE